MITTQEATRFCQFETEQQFRYAVKKNGLKPERIIGNSKFWNPEDLKPLVAQKATLETEAHEAVVQAKNAKSL